MEHPVNHQTQKDLVILHSARIPPPAIDLPNNEFFRNLAWTLWVPIGFTTVIEYVSKIWDDFDLYHNFMDCIIT